MPVTFKIITQKNTKAPKGILPKIGSLALKAGLLALSRKYILKSIKNDKDKKKWKSLFQGIVTTNPKIKNKKKAAIQTKTNIGKILDKAMKEALTRGKNIIKQQALNKTNTKPVIKSQEEAIKYVSSLNLPNTTGMTKGTNAKPVIKSQEEAIKYVSSLNLPNTTGKYDPLKDPKIPDNIKEYIRESIRKGTGNGDIITSALSMGDSFLKIDGKHYGGNQDWYLRKIEKNGGCGPTAAANIIAYLAQTHPSLSNLYNGNLSKSDYGKFMKTIYKYVHPLEILEVKTGNTTTAEITAGVPTLGMFSRGVERYAQENGCTLKANYSNKKPTFENAVEYIKEGLEKDSPVALLILYNSKLKEITYYDIDRGQEMISGFQWHWVTITAIHENTKTGDVYIDVSSWGNKATLSFKDVWKPNTGILYFD